MSYNVELQLAGILVIVTLGIVFFSKPRWKSIQNSIFRVLLIVTFFELILDALSVYTITHKEQFPIFNELVARGYIAFLVLWVAICVIYIISNTIHEKMSKQGIVCRKILVGIVLTLSVVLLLCVFTLPLYYECKGRIVYSYGPVAECAYIFFAICVIIALLCFIMSIKNVSWKRRVPILAFICTECLAAYLQKIMPEFLIIGFFSAFCVFIMYLTLENPDMDMIAKLDDAKKKADDLLLNILPKSIAEKLKDDVNHESLTDYYEDATIGFLDIVDFTSMSAKVGPEVLVKLLNSFFIEIDSIVEKYNIEKIKTIGDAYMVASGVPEKNQNHTSEMILFFKDVLNHLKDFNNRNGCDLQIRIGVHCGPVVAGIIGKKKFIYDLWGATVNYASRMESYGIPNKIQISEAVFKKMAKDTSYKFGRRSNVEVKGFGSCSTYVIM